MASGLTFPALNTGELNGPEPIGLAAGGDVRNRCNIPMWEDWFQFPSNASQLDAMKADPAVNADGFIAKMRTDGTYSHELTWIGAMAILQVNNEVLTKENAKWAVSMAAAVYRFGLWEVRAFGDGQLSNAVRAEARKKAADRKDFDTLMKAFERSDKSGDPTPPDVEV